MLCNCRPFAAVFASNSAPPSLCLLGLPLLNKAALSLATLLLPFLAQLLADFDRALRVIGENEIDLLEREVGGLGIAEIDKWHECEVEGHEDKVSFPLKAVDNHRGDHDDEEIPDSSVSFWMHCAGWHGHTTANCWRCRQRCPWLVRAGAGSPERST
jgi:hypothetical protein